VGHQGSKEPVDADDVCQALAVSDLQRLVGPVAEPAQLHALLGQHRRTKRAEHVVERRGAFPVAGVRPKAHQDAGVSQLAQAMLGAIVRAEEDLGELAGGEHAMLADKAHDGAVAAGEPTGEHSELLGQAAPPGGSASAAARAGSLARVVMACERPPGSQSAALPGAVMAAVTCRWAMVGGAGSKVGGRVGARGATDLEGGPCGLLGAARWQAGSFLLSGNPGCGVGRAHLEVVDDQTKQAQVG
jgi:hypothetical protein